MRITAPLIACALGACVTPEPARIVSETPDAVKIREIRHVTEPGSAEALAAATCARSGRRAEIQFREPFVNGSHLISDLHYRCIE